MRYLFALPRGGQGCPLDRLCHGNCGDGRCKPEMKPGWCRLQAGLRARALTITAVRRSSVLLHRKAGQLFVRGVHCGNGDNRSGALKIGHEPRGQQPTGHGNEKTKWRIVVENCREQLPERYVAEHLSDQSSVCDAECSTKCSTCSKSTTTSAVVFVSPAGDCFSSSRRGGETQAGVAVNGAGSPQAAA